QETRGGSGQCCEGRFPAEVSLNKSHVGKHKHTEYEARCQKNAFSGCHTWSLSSASAFVTIISSFCERDVANV
ncbi:hypothetical protein, partial [Escherichia coli]|uniref:hypothetical protein n=1 Tax=Escherichia coli TaxID=562 RepID=UPI0021E88150